MIYDILPVNNYMGNGAATVFDFDFYIDDASQLKVYFFDSDGAKYLLEKDIDYILEGEKNPNGGYITFPIEDSIYSVLADNQKISLELDIPVSQETQYNNSSLLNLETLEYSFDYLTRLIQILKRKLSLCVKVEECSQNTPEELLHSINEANVSTSLNSKEASLQKSLAQSAAKDAIRAKELTEEIYRNTKSFNEELIESGMYKFNLFDTKISDYILEGNEAKGWALQGTYVSGALYPDFYNKCLEQKNNAAEKDVTLGDSTLTMFVNSNGHQFYNISDKLIVDTFYNTYGIADFYGIDEENERIFLPRNKYFHQLTDDVSKVNEMVKAGLPNMEGTVTFLADSSSTGTNTLVSSKKNVRSDGNGYAQSQAGETRFQAYQKTLSASKSNPIYGNSNTVQPPSSLKLLYYCVGNTVINDSKIDAGALVSQMELKANKIDVDGQWVILQELLYLINGLTLTKQKSFTYLLSDLLPNDGCQYEVMLGGIGVTSTTSGNTANIYITTDLSPNNIYTWIINKEKTQASNSAHWGSSINVVVGTERSVTITNTGTADSTDVAFWVAGYRRIGTNV